MNMVEKNNAYLQWSYNHLKCFVDMFGHLSIYPSVLQQIKINIAGSASLCIERQKGLFEALPLLPQEGDLS